MIQTWSEPPLGSSQVCGVPGFMVDFLQHSSLGAHSELQAPKARAPTGSTSMPLRAPSRYSLARLPEARDIRVGCADPSGDDTCLGLGV